MEVENGPLDEHCSLQTGDVPLSWLFQLVLLWFRGLVECFTHTMLKLLIYSLLHVLAYPKWVVLCSTPSPRIEWRVHTSPCRYYRCFCLAPETLERFPIAKYSTFESIMQLLVQLLYAQLILHHWSYQKILFAFHEQGSANIRLPMASLSVSLAAAWLTLSSGCNGR